MRTLYAGSVAKDVERPEDNEDRFIVREDGRCIVVCDGASESFDAAAWASLVATRLDAAPFSTDALNGAVADYNAAISPQDLSWSKQMAFERGSFSTLCRVEQVDDRHLSVTAIGDSLMVLTDTATLLHTQPYASAGQFDERPLLVSTLSMHNGAFGDEAFVAGLSRSVVIPETTAFVLVMTDALGQWLLAQTEAGNATALSDLVSIRSDGELVALVESARASGMMRRDDSTLVVATAWDGP